MDPTLRGLLQTHTNGLIGDINTLAQMADCNFEQDLYPLWVQVDEQIPGPGLQFAYWKDGQLADYPFDYGIEQVVRPLRYVVYGLHAIGTPYMSTREIVSSIGGHLEGCVKDLCGVTKFDQPQFRTAFLSLGGLVKHHPLVCQRLDKDVRRAITSFCRLLWNPAKHVYHKDNRHNRRSPDPMIPFADAVAGYFLARALGAKVLCASGRLEPVVQTIRNERARLEDQID